MSVRCQHCPQVFVTGKGLNAHMRVHKPGHVRPELLRARAAVDELLAYVEAGRPSGYAPWREDDRQRMAEILIRSLKKLPTGKQ